MTSDEWSHTKRKPCGMADLKPETLAVMHGSSYIGQGDHLLTGLAAVIQENFDRA